MPADVETAENVAPAPPEPLEPDLRRRWHLNPEVTFLNHGSFGATPIAVLETQARLREAMERDPVLFLDRRRAELLQEARTRVAGLVGVSRVDLGFVTNATGGVNAVLRSLQINPGDELLTTNHVYNAIRQTMRYLAGRSGATYREIEIDLPIEGPEPIVRAIVSALDDRTRVVVLDHVSSPTALVFPLRQIIDECAAREVDVMIDGAHAPGMLDLDVSSLGAAYYTGNLHKWVCAPKGAAFLWVRPDRQAGIHPNTISHFLDEGFVPEFSWQGTRDVTAWLSAAAAIDFMAALGWDRVRRHNHRMATWVQFMLCHAWGVEPNAPLDGSMTGSMTTVTLPETLKARYERREALQAVLFDEHRIEVPVVEWSGRWFVRCSCQVYNRPEEYERLATTVSRLA